MVMGMDKKAAMKILQLPSGATAGDAKKAFRKLAKSFHPDRFARDESRARHAESRMKQINQAFYFLEPLLPQEAVPGTTPDLQKPKTPGMTLSDILKNIKSKVQTRSGGRPIPKVKSRVKNRVKTQKRAGSEVKSFNAVLHGIEPGIESGIPVGGSLKKKRRSHSGKDPVPTYEKYLALQKKVRSRQGRSREMGVGPVEKISRIQRVQRINPIGED